MTSKVTPEWLAAIFAVVFFVCLWFVVAPLSGGVSRPPSLRRQGGDLVVRLADQADTVETVEAFRV
jgi:hypothetical protein